MRALRVFLLFSWGDDNPYQELLAASLRQQGVQVEQPRPRLLLLPRLLRNWRGVKIIHLQAANPYFRAPTMLRAHFKAWALILQLWALRLLGAKIVWTVHDIKKQGVSFPRQHRRVSLRMARLSHAAIVHCPQALQEVAKHFRIANARTVHVVPHGNYIGVYPDTISSDAARAQLSLPKQPLVLLCMGLLEPYKGIERIIRAVESLGNEVHLIIAGRVSSASYASLLGTLVARSSNVTYLPQFVSPNEIQVFMRAADAVVFAYPEILTSGAVVLAMSFAKACIAPRVGCIPETLHPEGGILYDANDPAALLEALRRALHDRNELSRMGELNRERAKQWSWDYIASLTLDVYRSCLAQRPV